MERYQINEEKQAAFVGNKKDIKFRGKCHLCGKRGYLQKYARSKIGMRMWQVIPVPKRLFSWLTAALSSKLTNYGIKKEITELRSLP